MPEHMTDREIELLLQAIKDKTESQRRDHDQLQAWVKDQENRLRTVETAVSEQRGRESSTRSTWGNVLIVIGILIPAVLSLVAILAQ